MAWFSSEIDIVALGLVLLQAALLYRIALRAEALRGPRLLSAAKAAQAKLRQQPGQPQSQPQPRRDRSVLLDELPPARREMLDRLRMAYPGALDELWQPFLLRFLVAAEWNEAEALRKSSAAAAYRRESGAEAARRKCVAGYKLGQHPALARMHRCLGLAVYHRRAADGDLLTLSQVGSFDPDTWFDVMSGDEFDDFCTHLYEWLWYHADALSAAERTLVRQAIICDYDGLSWKHLNPRIFFRLRASVRAAADAFFGDASRAHLSPPLTPLRRAPRSPSAATPVRRSRR